MSTFTDIKFLSANRRFVADLPALRKPPTAAAPLNLSQLSNPIFGNTLRPKINQVDPHLLAAKISAANDNLTLPEIKANAPAPKVRRFYKTAAVLAGVAAFLTPAVALAGPLSGLFGLSFSVYAVGAALFFSAAGAIYLARTLYLNPRHGGRPGDPTGRKIITKLVLPALATVTTWGAALLSSTIAASLLGWSSSTFLLGMAAIAGTYTAGKIIISSTRLIMDRLRGVRRTVEKLSLKNRLLTNFLTLNAQFSYALYTSTRALTFASLVYGVVGRGALNLWHLNFSPLAPLIGAALGLLYGLYYRRPVAQRVNPNQAPQKMRWNKLIAAACVGGGAALGTAVGVVGYNPFLNLFFASALFVVEMHDVLHGWKTLGGARKVEEDVPRIYSDLEIWRAARARTGEFSSLIKPSFNNDVVPIISAKLFVREGSNWNINQVNSQDWCDVSATAGPRQILGVWRLFQTMDLTMRDFRHWVQLAAGDVTTAANSQQALLHTASLYERLANAYDTPNADNNFSPPYEGNFAHMNIEGFGDHTFSDPAADQHYQYVGKLIQTKANDFRQRAIQLREEAARLYHPDSVVGRAELHELISDLREEIDPLYRRFNAHYDMFLASFASNILPEIILTKIECLDAFDALTRDFITGISILRRNPDTGDIYMEIIPSNVVKDLRKDPEYKTVWNYESREKEDNRFHWFPRRTHEIGESHSDIAFIDMSNHYYLHKDDLNYYPTANVHTVPVLVADEFYDVVFKNGSRLRCYGDGRRVPTGNVPASARDIVWVAGTPAPTELLENTVDHAYGSSFSFYLKEPFAPRFYFFFQTPYQSMSDAEQLDAIVSDLLAYLVEDRQMPFAFYQFKIPEKLKLPYDPEMVDRPSDQLLQVAQGTSWFMLKVQEKGSDGRLHARYVPYNLRKDSYDLYVNEAAHPDRGWDSIDETVPVRLVSRGQRVDPTAPPCPYDRALVFTYKDGGHADPSFNDGNIYKRYPYPMGDPENYGGEAWIDLGRGKVGVMPIIKFVFLKRYDQGENRGKIIYKDGTISDAAWNAFVKKPVSQEVYEKMTEADRAQLPWVDAFDRVHIPEGFEVPADLPLAADRTIDIFTYREFRMSLLRETLYERFLPLESFAKFCDPNTIVLRK